MIYNECSTMVNLAFHTLFVTFNGLSREYLGQDIVPHFLFDNILRYIVSTLARAQGVFRKNFKLDLIEGLSVKQRMLITEPIYSHP